MSLKRVAAWFMALGDSVSSRILATHVIAFIGIVLAWHNGILGTVLSSGGNFTGAVAVLAVMTGIYGYAAARKFDKDRNILKARNAVTWMEWADGALLILGFLGTLSGAIIELTNLDPTAQGAAMLLGLKKVMQGVGMATYSLVAGTVAALCSTVWTKLLSNAVETAAETSAEVPFVPRYNPFGNGGRGPHLIETAAPPPVEETGTPKRGA